jgi:hypothetical protein
MHPAPSTARPCPWGTALLRGALAGLALGLALHAAYVLLGPNFHTVVPGAVYRCAQPSPRYLKRLVRKLGIRTVLNLRGYSEPASWYRQQCRVANELNLSHEELGFSAGRLPSVPLIRQVVEVLDRTEYPILIHCHKGADRTGMVATMYLLLHTDTPLAEARKHLGLRTGHLPLGRTRNIDRFFDLYQEWLAGQGRAHSRAAFRAWAEREYCPAGYRADLELLAPPGKPLRLRRFRQNLVRLRCTNTSVKPWRFKPGSNAGIHAQFDVLDAAGVRLANDKAGLFHATVAPGESIVLSLALPPLAPGRYQLVVDLCDEQHGGFLQLGGEPLSRELEVP